MASDETRQDTDENVSKTEEKESLQIQNSEINNTSTKNTENLAVADAKKTILRSPVKEKVKEKKSDPKSEKNKNKTTSTRKSKSAKSKNEYKQQLKNALKEIENYKRKLKETENKFEEVRDLNVQLQNKMIAKMDEYGESNNYYNTSKILTRFARTNLFLGLCSLFSTSI